LLYLYVELPGVKKNEEIREPERKCLQMSAIQQKQEIVPLGNKEKRNPRIRTHLLRRNGDFSRKDKTEKKERKRKRIALTTLPLSTLKSQTVSLKL